MIINISKCIMGHRSSHKLQTMFDLIRPHNRSFFSTNVTILERKYFPRTTISRYGHSMEYQGLKLFSTNRQTWTTFASKGVVRNGKEKVGVGPSVRKSPLQFFPSWVRWLLGSMLTLLPFSNEKLAKLQTIEGKTEIVVEEVESVAEMVEKAAKVAEKVSSDVADMLPRNGKLKETALFVERVSKIAAQDAQLTLDFIHKVDEVKHDLEDLETMVEPVVNVKHESQGK